MAIIRQVTLSPSTLELLLGYLERLPALLAHVGPNLTQVGAYGFDESLVGTMGHSVLGRRGSTTPAVRHLLRNDSLDIARS
ncbi:MAG: hypothetical protein ACI81L_002177 [Verrucomicrobiales bacterium]|jgi:hypothetical protein